MKKFHWNYEQGGILFEGVNVDGFPIHQFAYQPSSRYDLGWPIQIVTAGEDLWCEGCERKRSRNPLLAIEFFVEGQFEYEQNGRKSTPGPGEVFLVQPGESITMRYHGENIGRKKVLEITGPLVDPIMNLTQLNTIDCFVPTNVDWLLQQYEQAHQILEEAKPGYMQESSQLAYNVMTVLGRSAVQNNLPIVVRQAINLMEHRISTNLTLEELCEYCRASQPTLHRLFIKHLGEAPVSYYINLKIQAAKTSITAPGASIKEVAAELGYDNQQYFSAVFKRRVGISPRAYQKQVRQQAAENTTNA